MPWGIGSTYNVRGWCHLSTQQLNQWESLTFPVITITLYQPIAEGDIYANGSNLISGYIRLDGNTNLINTPTRLITSSQQFQLEGNLNTAVSIIINSYQQLNAESNIYVVGQRLINNYLQLQAEGNLDSTGSRFINAYQQLQSEGHIYTIGDIVLIIVYPSNPNADLFSSFIQGL